MKVWILFSVANDYNQPDAAFEKLYWEKPTAEQLAEELGYYKDSEPIKRLIENNSYKESGGTDYWITEFTKP